MSRSVKNQKIWIALVVLVVALILIWFLVGHRTKSATTTKVRASAHKEKGISLYYLKGCPHCRDVQKFLDEKNLSKTPDLRTTEISGKENQNDLTATKATWDYCFPNSPDGMQFPFMVVRTDGKNGALLTQCYKGSDKIISYFQDKLSQTKQLEVKSDAKKK